MAKFFKQFNLKQRRLRVRKKILGTKKQPRLSVFRSLNHIYAQIIDDEAQKTLVAFGDLKVKKKNQKQKISKMESAYNVGLGLAKKANSLGITKVIFDRGGYRYHGRIEKLAEGARKGGLQF